MTFKDLQRLVQSESGPNDNQSQLLSKLKGREFWFWDQVKHKQSHRANKGVCCFNHIIGLPAKDGAEKPIFDYEKMLYDALLKGAYLNGKPTNPTTKPNTVAHPFKVKHLWVKKATGLGVTEFMLRFMAWLCLYDDNYRGSQQVVITGPNQELAIKLIKRMKALFTNLGITFNSKVTVLELNGCSIEAYPSNHIDAFRSLTNPKFILIDEGDFFPQHQQQDVRHVAERYIAKSDPLSLWYLHLTRPMAYFRR